MHPVFVQQLTQVSSKRLSSRQVLSNFRGGFLYSCNKENMTKKQLQDALRKLSLPLTGNKAELVRRLENKQTICISWQNLVTRVQEAKEGNIKESEMEDEEEKEDEDEDEEVRSSFCSLSPFCDEMLILKSRKRKTVSQKPAAKKPRVDVCSSKNLGSSNNSLSSGGAKKLGVFLENRKIMRDPSSRKSASPLTTGAENPVYVDNIIRGCWNKPYLCDVLQVMDVLKSHGIIHPQLLGNLYLHFLFISSCIQQSQV